MIKKMKKTKIKKMLRVHFFLMAISVIFFCFLNLCLLPVSSQSGYSVRGEAKIGGRPAQKADVFAINRSRRNQQYKEKTDERGIYTFTGLTAGYYKFYLRDNGGLTLLGERVIGGGPVVISTGNTTVTTQVQTAYEFDFDVAESARLELRGVVKIEDNKAISDAVLKITNITTNATEEIRINADGTYEVSNLESGKYVIEVTAAGFETKSAKVTIEGGKTKTKNFELDEIKTQMKKEN